MLFLPFSCLLVLRWTSALKEVVKRKPGEDVTLQCSAPRDSTIAVLKWIRPDLEDSVYYYREKRSYDDFQSPTFHGRVELRDQKMKDGDMSVILKNVSSNDTGTYECHITVEKNGRRSNGTYVNRVIFLKVENPAGPIEDGGNTDGGRACVGLIAGLSVAGVGIVLVFFVLRYFSKKG